jgi:single-strand DNA-binding protein
MDLNRATILGRLTRDPEVKTIPNGRTVATMGVATNRVWTDQDGAKQERVEYHNCVLWGKLGEIAGQYLTKGRRVYMEGRIQTRDWVGQDGVKRYRTEIVVDNMIMLDGPRGTSASTSSQPTTDEPMPPADEGNSEEVKVEDIPF